ncbi:MAG: DUF932 domain-containing protein [Bacteroidales bacterium]|jgi:hypothetical protein
MSTFELSNESLQRMAPSIFATEKRFDRSKHYKFIPTIQVVDALRSEGFYPVKAVQSKSKNLEKRNHAKHMIRFRKDVTQEYAVGDLIPEIQLINSSDGTSQYLLNSGIYRLACSNGLVVNVSSIDSIKIRHSGDIIDNVIEGSYRIINETPKVFERIENMRSVNLSLPQRLAFARAVGALRWATKEYDVELSAFIAPIRDADKSNDLWTTMNILQEKIISGQALVINKETDKVRKARPVTNVDETSRLNQSVWMLAEELMKLTK